MYLPSLVNWFTTRDLGGWLSVIILNYFLVYFLCDEGFTHMIASMLFHHYRKKLCVI